MWFNLIILNTSLVFITIITEDSLYYEKFYRTPYDTTSQHGDGVGRYH